MKTRRDAINAYKMAFKDGTEGIQLLKTMSLLNSLDCSDEDKAKCLREEIDHIICGYLEAGANCDV